MKAFFLDLTRRTEVGEVCTDFPFYSGHFPPPVPDVGELLLETLATGVCSTDVKKIKDGIHIFNQGFEKERSTLNRSRVFLGHETVARVVSVGPDVSSGLMGKRVVIHDGVVCPAFGFSELCVHCKVGDGVHCLNKARRNHSRKREVFGGYSEKFIRHGSQILCIPDSIDDKSAVLIEPASIALNSLRTVYDGTEGEDPLLIIGGGTIAQIIVQIARILNLRRKIYLMNFFEFQEIRASRYETLPIDLKNSQDIRFFHIVDTLGSSESINMAVKLSHPKSSIVILGFEESAYTLPMMEIIQKGIKLLGLHGYKQPIHISPSSGDFSTIIELISNGKLVINDLITTVIHSYNLREVLKQMVDGKGNPRNRAFRSMVRFK